MNLRGGPEFLSDQETRSAAGVIIPTNDKLKRQETDAI
ncbi:hypothetical protein Ga0123462_0959 [Mariprofundus ferrinatatus]|uniref:Uncharacterized protein n=1 Tax=Mariprofundus ferrinatatus TaxID=1921087 RepID=A0A2K8L3B8_9PROT|nr:hypothetical protein Ga0123462_0959 [Mariprofundus ferrinatatus]